MFRRKQVGPLINFRPYYIIFFSPRGMRKWINQISVFKVAVSLL
jgi:hypothetical protein